MTYNFRRLSRAFASQDGRCYWCWSEMRLIPPPKKHRPHGKMEPDMATLDHLYARGDPRRTDLTVYPRIVAACFKCNNARGNLSPEDFAMKIHGNV